MRTGGQSRSGVVVPSRLDPAPSAKGADLSAQASAVSAAHARNKVAVFCSISLMIGLDLLANTYFVGSKFC